MSKPANISENIRQIQQNIADYATKHQNAAKNILLLAVSKTKPADMLEQAYQAGLHDFGESYLQEALGKIDDFCWHSRGRDHGCNYG